MAGSLFERYFFDAMANLGSSLGERSADNAARRQSIRARSAIDEMLGDASGADVMSAINNGQQFDLSKNTVLDPNFSLSKATPDGRSVQENAASELLDIKRRGQYPIGSSGSALQALSSASGKTPVSIEDVRMALRKRGVDEDIIEKELGYYNSKIKEQANATLVPQIMGKYNSGDYTGAFLDTLTLRQHDPETAGILLSGSVTPRDLYINGQNSDSRKQQHVWDMEAEARKISNEKDMELFKADLARKVANWSVEDKVAFAQRNPSFAGIVFGKSAGGSGSGKDIFDSGAFKAAKEQVSMLDEKVALGGELTPAEKQRYAQANAILNSAFGSFFQSPEQQQGSQKKENINDYNTAIRFVTRIKDGAAGKYSNEQIAQAVRQEYGLAADDTSNAFVEKILSDAGLVAVAKNNAPQKDAERERMAREAEEAVAAAELKERRANAAFVNPYTGTPYANHPYLGTK